MAWGPVGLDLAPRSSPPRGPAAPELRLRVWALSRGPVADRHRRSELLPQT